MKTNETTYYKSLDEMILSAVKNEKIYCTWQGGCALDTKLTALKIVLGICLLPLAIGLWFISIPAVLIFLIFRRTKGVESILVLTDKGVNLLGGICLHKNRGYTYSSSVAINIRNLKVENDALAKNTIICDDNNKITIPKANLTSINLWPHRHYAIGTGIALLETAEILMRKTEQLEQCPLQKAAC